MTDYVIDASVAIKWVVEEPGTAEALALRNGGRLMAPELLVAECANILWKKSIRNELSRQEALLAAKLLKSAEIELIPMRGLLEAVTAIAIDLQHPAYDALYVAVALERDCRFVTADQGLVNKLKASRVPRYRRCAVSLAEVANG